MYVIGSISLWDTMRPVLTTRNTVILSVVLFWAITGWAHAVAATSLEKEHDWLEEASQLVVQAQSSQSDAVQFNKDVRESRTQLRNMVQQARHVKLSAVHQELHSIMLVMGVLLKSAAACQAGGHIVCPPMLMSQLKTVLKNAYTKLDEIKQTSNNPNARKS